MNETKSHTSIRILFYSKIHHSLKVKCFVECQTDLIMFVLYVGLFVSKYFESTYSVIELHYRVAVFVGFH